MFVKTKHVIRYMIFCSINLFNAEMSQNFYILIFILVTLRPLDAPDE